MLVYAGIDEAGYGPMLGPLCIGCCVITIDSWAEGEHAPDLWELLAGCVARRRLGAGNRLVVADSKKVKLPNNSKKNHPLKFLERGVLAMLPEMPTDDLSFFEQVGSHLGEAPWYGGAAQTLPVGNDRTLLRISANQLQQACRSAGLSVRTMHCRTLDAARFNQGVGEMGSKAAVSFDLVARTIERIWSAHKDSHPRVIVDRQGGRLQYRPALQRAFPDASVQIVAESQDVCRYLLRRGESELTLSFLVEAEDRHFPVALASMLAKYIRELAMARFNRYFQSRMPELEPTAGYVQDARRWLHDASAVVEEIDRRMLVRCR